MTRAGRATTSWRSVSTSTRSSQPCPAFRRTRVAPSTIPDIGIAAVTVKIALLDRDVGIGFNVRQQFRTAIGRLAGTITYAYGESDPFSFGTDILLANASSSEASNDTVIDVTLALDPLATLSNSTDLGVNVLWTLDLLTISGSCEIVDIREGSFATAVVIDLGGSVPTASVEVSGARFDFFDVAPKVRGLAA